MEPFYYIRGDDGEEYGPVTWAELQAWASEGRVGMGTPVRLESGEWRLWEDFPELQQTPLAKLGPRFVAFAIDNVILVSIMTLAVAVVWEGIPAVNVSTMAEFLKLMKHPVWVEMNQALQLLTMVLHLIYFTVWHGGWGWTPGKRLMGLRVVTRNGERLGWAGAVLRGVSSLFSTYFLYAGYWVAAFSSERRTVHDWLAGTKVVQHVTKATPL